VGTWYPVATKPSLNGAIITDFEQITFHADGSVATRREDQSGIRSKAGTYTYDADEGTVTAILSGDFDELQKFEQTRKGLATQVLWKNLELDFEQTQRKEWVLPGTDEWERHEKIQLRSSGVFILAPSGESISIECLSEGLYFAYQIDNFPACHEFSCTAIRARAQDGEWIQYAAHNGGDSGFIRSERSNLRKNGAAAESLLDRILTASRVEFLNPATGEPVAFSITEMHRGELVSIAAKCGIR